MNYQILIKFGPLSLRISKHVISAVNDLDALKIRDMPL